jgi:hypothetical protein
VIPERMNGGRGRRNAHLCKPCDTLRMDV